MIPQTPTTANTTALVAPPTVVARIPQYPTQAGVNQQEPISNYYQPIENIYNVPHDDRSRTLISQRDFYNIYSEPYLQSNLHRRAQPQTPSTRPQIAVAQPQVPTSTRPLLRRHSVRRLSEGSSISDGPKESRISYESNDYMSINSESMRQQDKDYLTSNGSNKPGCRLSLDAGRPDRLQSTTLEGSKDSLSSFGSSSTLTGQDTDDSIIMSRLRKNFEKKEAFLRRPSKPTGFLESPADNTSSKSTSPVVIQREFYGRPQKLQKPVWPPTSNFQQTPSSSKPLHQDFERIKSDLNIEKEFLRDKDLSYLNDLDQCYMSDSETQYQSDGLKLATAAAIASAAAPLQKSASQREKNAFASTLSRIHENIPSTVTNFGMIGDDSNGTSSERSSESRLSESNR